ncbi:MAG: hypothetical protein AAF702_49585 [Chloroflexota bacterium]
MKTTEIQFSQAMQVGTLEEAFPSWSFNVIESSGDYSHIHIKPKEKKVTGVLEIDLDDNSVKLKLADNRKTDWSSKAYEELEEFVKSAVSP